MGVGQIREARKARGWTQEQLGKRAGLQTALVGSYEVGRRPLYRADAKKLSEVLKMKDDLSLRISNATDRFARAQRKDDAASAIKVAGRLIELAEEADENGSGYTVDWDALEDLVDGLAGQIGGVKDDNDDDDEDFDDDMGRDEARSKNLRAESSVGQAEFQLKRAG